MTVSKTFSGTKFFERCRGNVTGCNPVVGPMHACIVVLIMFHHQVYHPDLIVPLCFSQQIICRTLEDVMQICSKTCSYCHRVVMVRGVVMVGGVATMG